MKKIMLVLMIAIGLSSIAFGQGKLLKDPKVEAEIIALERAGWESWKNKSPVWFQANTTDEVMSINFAGVSNKAQMIKDLTSCEVKSVALDNFNFVMTGNDSIV